MCVLQAVNRCLYSLLSSLQHSQEEGLRCQVPDETESPECQVKVSDLIIRAGPASTLKALSALNAACTRETDGFMFSTHMHSDIQLPALGDLVEV